MTKAAFVAASRYAGKLVVLASSERIDFVRAVEIGDIVEAEARVERVGRSSMSIETKLWSENLLTGERRITATGHFTMVAVGEDHRPIAVRDVATEDVLPSGSRSA